MTDPLVYQPATDAQIQACFEVFAELRPHLSAAGFLAQVRRQALQGYRIAAIQEDGRVVSAAGFRLCEFLAWGSILYIDDLSTLPESRGKGHGGRLLDWLLDHARQHDCDAVHLDTGYGRHAAHRLYLNKGFELVSHHMARRSEAG